MKARWWLTFCVHFTLVLIVATQCFAVGFATTYFLSKARYAMKEGWINPFEHRKHTSWVPEYLRWQNWAIDHGIWLLLAILIGWVMFEWRCKSEYKTQLRLVALSLGACVTTTASLITA